MRIKVIIFFLLLSTNYVFAQKVNFLDSASQSYWKGNYSSAISFYKKWIRNRCDSYYMQKLGECYIKMDSIEQAKDVLQNAIDCGYPGSIQLTCYHNLADIYFKQKNYKKALTLYNIFGAKWELAKPADANHLYFHLSKAICISKCYEGLKMIDSAINVITPYIFCNYYSLGDFSGTLSIKPPIEDSLKHDSVCMRYLTLLKQRHTNRNIKNELKKAEASYQYIEDIKPIKNDSTYFDKKLKCKIQFYGVNVNVGEGSVILKKSELEIKKKYFYTKEQMLQRFHDLPLYRMITEL